MTDWAVGDRVRLKLGPDAGAEGTIVGFHYDGRLLVKWDDDFEYDSGESAETIELIPEGSNG